MYNRQRSNLHPVYFSLHSSDFCLTCIRVHCFLHFFCYLDFPLPEHCLLPKNGITVSESQWISWSYRRWEEDCGYPEQCIPSLPKLLWLLLVYKNYLCRDFVGGGGGRGGGVSYKIPPFAPSSLGWEHPSHFSQTKTCVCMRLTVLQPGHSALSLSLPLVCLFCPGVGSIPVLYPFRQQVQYNDDESYIATVYKFLWSWGTQKSSIFPDSSYLQ